MKYLLIIFVFFISFTFNFVKANNLESLKKECSEIGYVLGSEKHGMCVLKLLKKIKNKPVQPSNFEKPFYSKQKKLSTYLEECSQGPINIKQNFVTQMQCWTEMMEDFGNEKFGYNWKNSRNSYAKLLQSLQSFAKIAQNQVSHGNADPNNSMAEVKKYALNISQNANALDSQRANSSLNMMLLGLSIMNNGIPAYGSAGNSVVHNTPGFLTGSKVSGLNRICYYNKGGSTSAKTIGRAQLCSLID